MKKILLFAILLALFSTNNVLAVTNYNQITNSDFLITQGSKIVKKSNGQIVVLQGLNIGGWLFQTKSMSPINMNASNDFSIIDVYTTLSKRGFDSNSLFNVYYTNFITEYDLDEIAKTGANVVRIPFWWRNLLNEDGTYKLDKNGNIDFTYFDWIVAECGKRGMYVVFDLHAAPGGQSPTSHAAAFRNSSGQYEAQLFLKNDTGQKYRKWTVELWKNIARHFNNNPIVAGYDILNEPWDDSNPSSISYHHTDLYEFYNWIYKEIRNVDTNHIIFMESCWQLDEIIQYGKNSNWKFVAYSPHDYPVHAEEKQDEQKLHSYFTTILNSHKSLMSQYNVPIYVGELTCYDFWNQCNYIFGLYKNAGISYTPWSYKINARDSYFGVLYRSNGPAIKANMSSDSYNTIKDIFSYRTEQHYILNNRAKNVLINQFGGRFVISLSLNVNNLTLKVGDKATLSVEVLPNNAINKDVIWVSSDNSVASVDSNGIITAKNNGTVYIVAKSKENLDIKASCKVTIQGNSDVSVPVSSIVLNKNEVELYEGTTYKIDANVLPSNATNKELIYSSSNSNIATVDSSGNVVTKKSGVVTITVKSKTYENISVFCRITVLAKSSVSIPIDYVTLNYQNLMLKIEDEKTLVAFVYPTNASNKSIIWQSDNPDVALIGNDGKVIAISEGVAYITARSLENPNIKATCKVFVTNDDHSSEIVSISINNPKLELYEGTMMQVGITTVPFSITNENLVWETSNNDIITVNEYGVVTANKIGNAKVKVIYRSNPKVFAEAKINVVEKPKSEVVAESIELDIYSTTIYIDGSLSLSATVLPITATNKSIIWESSNIDIATVDSDGVVVAQKPGVVTITAKLKENPLIEAKCEIIVEERELLYVNNNIEIYFKIVIAVVVAFILFLIILNIKGARKKRIK